MSDTQRTHWDGCATTGGPAHYWCAVGRICDLKAELARVREERDAWERRAGDYMDDRDTAWAERDALRADAERFAWWFSFAPKPDWFVARYLQGVREKFTLDQWRYTIDDARAKEKA